jgi:hypothetical protein
VYRHGASDAEDGLVRNRARQVIQADGRRRKPEARVGGGQRVLMRGKRGARCRKKALDTLVPQAVPNVGEPEPEDLSSRAMELVASVVYAAHIVKNGGERDEQVGRDIVYAKPGSGERLVAVELVQSK